MLGDKTGVINAKGRLLVPLLTDVKAINALGHDLWEIELRRQPHDVFRVYAQGRLDERFAAYRRIRPFVNQRAHAWLKRNGAPVILQPSGQLLASYAALYPGTTRAERGQSPKVEMLLNRCLVEDPTLPKNKRPSPSEATRRICADNSLARLSLATETRYRAVQSTAAMPRVFARLHQDYAQQLAACGDKACFKKTMHDFQQTLVAKRKALARSPNRLSWSRRPVSVEDKAAIVALLDRQQSRVDAAKAAQKPAGAKGALIFSALQLGTHQAVLVSLDMKAPNRHFWLLTQGANGKWQRRLQATIGDLQKLVSAGEQHGWPILRVPVRAAAAGSELYRFYIFGQKFAPDRYSRTAACQRLIYQPAGLAPTDITLCGSRERAARLLRDGPQKPAS